MNANTNPPKDNSDLAKSENKDSDTQNQSSNINDIAKELVKILKDLQVQSMGVDLSTPPEDNIDYLTNKLHWAEVQILALIQREKIKELKFCKKLGGYKFDENIDDRINQLREEAK